MRDREGFTIPELLVVALIIGIVSMMVVPHLEIVKYRMDGSSRGLMAALVTAQRSAVKRQHDVVVAFDTTVGSVRIHEDANNNGAVDEGERIRHVVLDDGVAFGLGAAPARSGAAEVITFTGTQDGMPAVRFHRSGSASEQGSLYLTSERARRDTSFTKDTRSIQVERATGRTSWYFYEAPDWRQGF